MSRYLTLSGPSGISGADLKRRIGAIMDGRALRSLSRAKRALLGSCGIATLAAPLALGLAASPLTVLAQAPASVQGAVGAALSAPPQAKVAPATGAPTVAPGQGGVQPTAADTAQQLEAAIAAGDVRQVLLLPGNTWSDLFRAEQVKGNIPKDAANNGGMVSANGDIFLYLDAQTGPGRYNGRLRVVDALGDYAMSLLNGAEINTEVPAAERAARSAAAQALFSGGSAQSAANAYYAAASGQTAGAEGILFQRPDGSGVGLIARSADGANARQLLIPDSQGFSGLAGLPTQAEAEARFCGPPQQNGSSCPPGTR